MIRRLSTHVSAASLVLCAATCVLWVRSYRAADTFVFREDGLLWRVASERGLIRVDDRPQFEADTREQEQRLASLRALQATITDQLADLPARGHRERERKL